MLTCFPFEYLKKQAIIKVTLILTDWHQAKQL